MIQIKIGFPLIFEILSKNETNRELQPRTFMTEACILGHGTRIGPRRAWQPIPVSFPGESKGHRSLVAYNHRVAKSRIQLKQLSTYAQGQGGITTGGVAVWSEKRELGIERAGMQQDKRDGKTNLGKGEFQEEVGTVWKNLECVKKFNL